MSYFETPLPNQLQQFFQPYICGTDSSHQYDGLFREKDDRLCYQCSEKEWTIDRELSHTKIMLPSKRKKRCKQLEKEDFESVWHLSQQEASKATGISLPTFKRQFYALRKIYPNMRWPTPKEQQIMREERERGERWSLHRRLEKIVSFSERLLMGQEMDYHGGARLDHEMSRREQQPIGTVCGDGGTDDAEQELLGNGQELLGNIIRTENAKLECRLNVPQQGSGLYLPIAVVGTQERELNLKRFVSHSKRNRHCVLYRGNLNDVDGPWRDLNGIHLLLDEYGMLLGASKEFFSIIGGELYFTAAKGLYNIRKNSLGIFSDDYYVDLAQRCIDGDVRLLYNDSYFDRKGELLLFSCELNVYEGSLLWIRMHPSDSINLEIGLNDLRFKKYSDDIVVSGKTNPDKILDHVLTMQFLNQHLS